MTSDRLALDYLRRAQARRLSLDTLLRAEVHADVVRESQNIIELILKGALRFVGVDPPKRHDVHAAVRRFEDRLPDDWRQALDELQGVLDEIASGRAPAFYGDEQQGVPASELFGEADAIRAMDAVDRLLELYQRLVGLEGGPRR